MAKALKSGDSGSEVKSLQTALNDAGAKPKLKADGKFGPATEEAVKAFQKQNKLKQDGVAGREVMDTLSKNGAPKGKEPEKEAGGGKSGKDNIEGGADILKSVDSGLQKKVLAFAEKFGPITISDGKRTVKEQAELMAPMSDQDLDMYGAGPYVDEIKKLDKKNRTTKQVEEILDKWIKQGSRVSWHLQGKAIDISAKGSFDWAKAEKTAKEVGLKPKLEKWRNCFHVQ